jgi:hypothetical protein
MNLSFFEAAAERAVKTFAQTLIAVLTLSSAPLDVMHTAWQGDLSLALGATLLSLLTSLAGLTPPVSGPAVPSAPLAGDGPKHAADAAPVTAPIVLPPVPAAAGDSHGA